MSKYKNISRLSNIAGQNIDTRSVFDETLAEIGYLHIVRKADLTKRCSCIALRTDRHNEPDPECKICYDLGYLSIDNEILAFKSYQGGKEQAASPQRMRASEQAFFVRYNVFDDDKTAEYSRILELKTDGNGNILPGNIVIKEYNIVDAIPWIEKGIRIYWKLFVVSKDI